MAEVAFAVLTNGPLLDSILSYQHGLSQGVSKIVMGYRKKTKHALVCKKQKQALLASPDMFRAYVLLKLIEKKDVRGAKALMAERPTGYTCPTFEGGYLYGINTAAQLRDAALVTFLHKQNVGKCTKHALDTAASNGDFEIAEFLVMNRDEGCSLAGFMLAEKHGHTKVLEFLREHRPRDQNKCPPVDPKFSLLPTWFVNL
ncbi:hypothetical protein SPRG_01906 [Saprolegnia parasitica CBS 223.65]|uniref:Uncharacterized protein n=1 Tax=Saprolegnia parasitica (strain CBS 223.65) TaxID=695850 RepID=A0A067CRG2_SAPPC|nr:hypothetical protein SPRG_01906 [Saprolegnia parasitica CBS 223.65]KDO33093.1 hypothetical protein SPRG_01906 [Saprolegnia parasitica CBS 223.65]|eukprot:XP_012195862.1 hypothetical protein SPRG_01906 [Saprolegnia parasitica CBS 223.65]